MQNRNILLPKESYPDFQDALSKSNLEPKRFTWERLKANGMTAEMEKNFRYNCMVVGFKLPQE